MAVPLSGAPTHRRLDISADLITRTLAMIRTLLKLAAALLSFVLISVLPLAAHAAEDAYLDSLELLDLLHNRQYQELEKRLSDAQDGYENGEVSDIVVMLAFDALANSDPAHEELLNEWVESMPNSYIALAARGIYFADVGWSLRGSAYAGETSDEQFAGMRGFHAHAISDLQNALNRNPRLIVGYAEIISLSKSSGKRALRKDTLEKALEIDPASYAVRKSHLFGLMPRWGGSYEEIEQFIADTRTYADENPKLKPLLGFADYVRARKSSGRSDYETAIEHYTKALKYGDKAWYYRSRGTAYYQMDDYDNALKDLTRAIELWPQYPEALAWRGTVYEAQEMYDQALADLFLAARLKPYGYLAQKHLGNVLAKKQRYEEAVQAYDAALHYQPHRGHLWRKKAWYLAYKLQKPEEAAEAYKMAAEKRPDRAAYWYDYGYVLNTLHDCEVVPVLRTFVRACGNSTDDRCDKRHTRWAKRTVSHALAQASCPDKGPYPTTRKTKTKRIATKSTEHGLNPWELYKLYVRGVIWVVLEWLGLPP